MYCIYIFNNQSHIRQVVVGAAQLVGSWDPRAEQVETEGGGGIHPKGLKMVLLHSLWFERDQIWLKTDKTGLKIN